LGVVILIQVGVGLLIAMMTELAGALLANLRGRNVS